MAQNNYVDEMTINGVSHEIQDTVARERIALLEEAYQGLTQSDIIIVDGDLPVSGQEKNKIYRKTGTNSYTDYMWDGTQFVPMATYNNAVDTTFDPTSDNLASEKATATYLAEKLAKKANINGTYLAMCVGMAKNVEAQSELSGTSLFRPTAGENEVADGPASVKVVKGNAMAWNQLYGSLAPGGYCSVTDNQDGTYTITAIQNTNVMIARCLCALSQNHKYYITTNILSGNNVPYVFSKVINQSWEEIQTVTVDSIFSFTSETESYHVSFNFQKTDPNAATTIIVTQPLLIDLTLMFGAGNEPSSAAEFKTWLQNNIGLQPYYAYNAGKLLATKLLGLRTVWLNQWDEQWENGSFDENGNETVTSYAIRSKNYIKVIPNTTYYWYKPKEGRVYFFDAEKNFISRTDVKYTSTIINVPLNCSYIRFYVYGGTSGYSYNHDICINLHYTNGRDGEYEPYEEHNYDFDTSKVYGKLNGEGNYVQVFPDGLKSAGSARDELVIKDGVAIKRVGSEDLGTLNWNYSSGLAIFTAPQIKGNRTLQGICQTYTYQAGGPLIDKCFSISSSHYGRGTGLCIKDTAYTDAAAFKTAMDGVMLYYELDEPVEYTDLVYRDNGVDTPIDALNLLVSNYGTEEQIVVSPTDGDPNSCAATLDTLYGLNASDFMDAANNGAFISKASMDAFLSALGAAMGGTWSQTWNDSTGHYDYAFTATPQVENQE